MVQGPPRGWQGRLAVSIKVGTWVEHICIALLSAGLDVHLGEGSDDHG